MKLPIGASLVGVGKAVPTSVVTNADLEGLVDTSDEWITTRTGIRQRHVVSEGETATGLAIEAARDAIGFAAIDPASIDMIIVATSTPDNLYPSTACMVQAAIGATRAAAFDMEAACTGTIYAVAIGQQFIGSGTFKTVLVIGVDVHSRFLNWEDRNTCILFGDGAGAFIMQASEQNDILATYLRADGTGGHLLCIPNSGVHYPHVGTTQEKATHRFLQMNGKAVYEFAINAVPEAVKEACSRAEIEIKDIDFLVPHQANQRIIKAAAERLGLSKEQIISNLDQVGNTSAASIPLAMADALMRQQITPPAVCVFVGFGAGLTWGSAIVRWTALDQRRLEKTEDTSANKTSGSHKKKSTGERTVRL